MRRRFLWLQALLDGAALAVGLGLASLIVFGSPLPWMVRPQAVPLLAVMFAGLAASEWASSRLWAGAAPRPSYGRALTIAAITIGLTALSLAAARFYFSRSLLAWSTVFFLAGAFGHRAWQRRRPWTERLALITNEKTLVDDLQMAPHAAVTAILDPGEEGDISPPEAGTVVVVDLRAVLSDRMAQYVSSCTLAGFDVRPLSEVYEMHTGRMPVVALAEGWELSAPVLRAAPYLPGKRLFDIATVALTVPLTLLIFGATALIVRVTSPGPVIFRQTRVGRGGDLFTLYKFRTMREGAERDGPAFAAVGDRRLTSCGRWLRRFRVDEVPQLWNVLRGDLSLVGPRPEQKAFVDRFSETIPFYSHRHMVRPGLTGWAQVNYGYADGDADTMDKLTYDLYYLKHMSPWLDLEILGRSLWTVLSGYGAR